MTKKQQIDALAETIENIVGHYQRLDAACDAARDAGCLSTEGKLHDAIWEGFSGMLNLMDHDEWISWFIFENDCGKRALKAGFDGHLRPIRTARQLAKLITEHENKP